ncbi:MAG TPA: DEAD/DEAH box helicase [Streptosporangiaceae bacterium]|nr:DEAD/DEAH box helicase [Streptosporangiaceae bacterium]
MLEEFHPAIRTWFERRFPAGPTRPQAGGWRQIAAGRHTLIAAPTGSGKTLAAFAVCIDRLYRAHQAAADAAAPQAAAHQAAADPAAPQDGLPRGPQVVYVSPLKALAADIQQNLEAPLREIAATAAGLGLPAPDIRVALRTGDTAAAQRTAMLKRPPDFLITTPESLYLLVTAERSRAMLRGVRTVIVDEIHAVAGSKRGSHLALTLERLAHVAAAPLQRVGLSATVRPAEAVARLLVGAGPDRDNPDGSPRCAIVDSGHRRRLDLALELPGDELGAVATSEQMAEILDMIAAHVTRHRTTLVFVNTRRMAERVAHQLGERLGEELGAKVAAHHGSLSRDRRQRVEERLRSGDLRALVATASLELGIDIGPVELVCQIGSPRSFATFLQRVGRSNHTRGGTPAGRLYPTSRDELVECAALLRGVRAGRLDALVIPQRPLDILAQQIVAEAAAEQWREDELFALVRRAAPFRDLAKEDFEDVAGLLAEGIRTGRGRRAYYLHRDRVNGTVKARRGARMAALTSGGAIPELGDYRVVAEPDDVTVGTVNEDWAVESMAGDVFLLGTHSWRIRRVEPGTVRVVDAQGAPPTVPFWLGEAPGRTRELSEEVSALRRAVAGRDAAGARRWLEAECGLGRDAAQAITEYLHAALAALGALPTTDTIILERFFDEAGGMQLVGHAPFGARVNRAFGLALRKRFCVTFDFELQAAASDNAILLSLGPQHSFPLDRVPKFLASPTVEQVVRQAVLTSPLFAARWRWNLNTSLTVLRMRGGRKNPPAIQRMEADDLMAAVFPTLAACQENVAPGPLEIPDHVLVAQTLADCLHEAMDIDGLRELVSGIEADRITVLTRDTTEPSVLAHEILNGMPFTFLDDAPLEERRSRQVRLPRGLPVAARDLARLDPDAIGRVREQVRPEPRDADELHDLLMTLYALRPQPRWRPWFAELAASGRACEFGTQAGPLWCARERIAALRSLYPGTACWPADPGPPASQMDPETAAAEMLRGHLDVSGPVTPAALARATGLGEPEVALALTRLETEGFALRGRFTDPDGGEEFCARRVLTRIHAYTRQRKRSEVRPVPPRDFIRFVLRWQHVAPGTRREGSRGVLAVVEQLQGFELAAGAWEDAVLAARVAGYRREWLDEACLSGDVAWGRLSLRPDADQPQRSGQTPSRATPVTLAIRDDLPWLLRAARGDRVPARPGPGRTRDVLDALAGRGALFPADIAAATRRLPGEIEEALWDGVARGLVTSDGFRAVRSLLARRLLASAPSGRSRGLRRGGRLSAPSGGRWSLLPGAAAGCDPDELAEAVAEQLAVRWGVVFYDLLARESLALPWREVLWAFRRMEARGTIAGGRFVAGFSGEQFAHPDAVDLLRRAARQPRTGETVRLSAADPLNLAGIILPGPRIPAVPTNSVTYTDGALAVPAGPAAARPPVLTG